MRIWVDPTKRAWRRYHGGSYGEVMVGYDESGDVFYATGNEFCENLGWERAENVLIEDSDRFEFVCRDMAASGKVEGLREGDFTGMCRPRAKAARKVAPKAKETAPRAKNEAPRAKSGQKGQPRGRKTARSTVSEPPARQNASAGRKKAPEATQGAVSGSDLKVAVSNMCTSAQKGRKMASESLSGAHKGTRRSCLYKEGADRASAFAAIHGYWSRMAPAGLSA